MSYKLGKGDDSRLTVQLKGVVLMPITAGIVQG